MSTANAAATPPVLLPNPAPPLPYADLPSRWGICVDRSPGGVRVVVPPVPSWRQLHIGFFVGGGILALFVATGAFITFRTADRGPLVANSIMYGAALLWVILAAWHRLRRRIVLEVTRSTVSATRLSPRGAGRRVEWPREKVAEIKHNPSNGKLVIRVAGVAFVELYLGPNRELNAHVADVLAAALREPPRAEATAAAAGEPPLGAAAGTPAAVDGVHSRGGRRALLAVAALMAVAAVVMMFLPFPAGVIGGYLLLFAAAPVGIALGTQEKDFYV